MDSSLALRQWAWWIIIFSLVSPSLLAAPRLLVLDGGGIIPNGGESSYHYFADVGKSLTLHFRLVNAGDRTLSINSVTFLEANATSEWQIRLLSYRQMEPNEDIFMEVDLTPKEALLRTANVAGVNLLL